MDSSSPNNRAEKCPRFNKCPSGEPNDYIKSDGEDPTQYENLPFAQRGLFDVYHNFGSFITVKKGTIKQKERVLAVFRSMYEFAMNEDYRTRIHIAFDPALWEKWNPGIQLEQRPNNGYLIDTSTKFVNTFGDIFFYIKSDIKKNVEDLVSKLENKLETQVGLKPTDITITNSNEFGNKGIINGSFREGIANLSNRRAVDQNILIGSTDKGKIGGAYLLTQKFRTCWEILETKTQSAKEEMIGRKMFDLGIIPCKDESSHIKRAHKMEDFPPPCNVTKGLRRVFRQSMPYGKCQSQHGREEGVFFVSYAKSLNTFKDILKNLSGEPGTTFDHFMNVFAAIEGSFWYIPSIKELNIQSTVLCKVDLDEHWALRRKNEYIFYNHHQYLHEMEENHLHIPSNQDECLTPRVQSLMQYVFEQWETAWIKKIDTPDIPDLSTVLKGQKKQILQESVPLRKGMAEKKCLGEVFTTADMESNLNDPSKFYGFKADLFNIHPDEIIVGRMPKVSTLGLGKKVMKYLTEKERMDCFLLGLSESSSIGHVIPDHGKMLRLGVQGMIDDIKARKNKDGSSLKKEFFESCLRALEGMQMYISNYGKLAKHLSTLEGEYTQKQRDNFKRIQFRMENLSQNPPQNLTEALQLIFSTHGCLHLIGQPVAVGRLDVLLAEFLSSIDKTNLESEANWQEIFDCFWIKFGERVILDPHNATDTTSWGNCAVPYSSDGNFPRGDSLNQWVQQITVGGRTDDKDTHSTQKAIALHCLKAARRLPLNAPCLSLRLYKDIDEEILKETSKSLLSGGAHPILMHEDRIVEALKTSPHLLPNPIPESDIRNFACDGCYEPLIAGKSEFTFTYIPLPKILELTINRGDTYNAAGPAYLQGVPSSYRTPPVSDINTFSSLKNVFEEHLKIQIESSMYKLLMNYGNIWKACPAPLLSSLIDGCLESGRDLYNGGAKYKIAACMFIGFANCVDSLYSIQKLCFDETSACVSLEELLCALKNDWGFGMVEPLLDDNAGRIRATEKSTYYQSLRDRVLAFPKFGTDAGAGDREIIKIAEWLSFLTMSTFKNIVQESNPASPFHQLLTRLKADYSAPDAPFEVIFCAGSGTFEGYVGWGMSLGASADGRRKGMPIASDFSAAPCIQDGPCEASKNDIYRSLGAWNIDAIKTGFSNGAEIDLNIREDFPEQELVDFLREYADGESIGGNIITVTCADEDTYQNALKNAEKYDLLRVRMGGWSEYFVAMFNAHKKQHMRRPYYLPPSQTNPSN